MAKRDRRPRGTSHRARGSNLHALVDVALAIVAFAIVTSTAPTGARAQDPEHAPREAIELYERGRALYAEGRYEEAAAELERALQLDPGAPVLVYNVALVHERLGNLDRAIEYYARYLLVLPDDQTEERERTEATLRRLRGAAAQQRRQTDADRRQRERERIAAAELARQQALRERQGDGEGPSDRRPRRRGRFDVAVIATGGAAIGLAAVGTVFGVMAMSSRSDVEDFVVGETGTLDERTDLADGASRDALIADVLFGAAIGAGATAALLYFLRDAPEDDAERPARARARASVAPLRDGAALVVEGSIP
ncbi:MAG: tetratricopeptide repeat protein [Deltaproteobacteria bacterium]|nr:tetratricopeptide repeat protein [Deltaproteobacteria bacterium]